MQSHRLLLCLAAAACAASASVEIRAQGVSSAGVVQAGQAGSLLPGKGRGYLGLNPARSRAGVTCGTTSLGCEVGDNSVNLYSVPLVGNFWGVELGYVDVGRVSRTGGAGKTQGLNFSMVGKAPIASSFGVFGKFGTTYGRTENLMPSATALAGGTNRGFGLSFGAGMSYEVTPRLSATLSWDSHDFQFPGSGRDSVRSTNLGMQYRY